MDRAYDLYVEHLKRCLTGLLEEETFTPSSRPPGLKGLIYDQIARRGYTIGRMRPIDAEMVSEGQAWPPHGLTMVGTIRLENLRACLEEIIRCDIPGNVIEAGVWRGGASLFMKAILAAHTDARELWLADSFAGLPRPDPKRYPLDASLHLWQFRILSQSLETVRESFRRHGLLDDRVHFLEGWFRDTLPTLQGHRWSLIRLDGDLYESTMDGLTNLYPGLEPGGFIVIDDYGDLPQCKAAVEDYRSSNVITEPMKMIDHSGVYWQKSQ